MHKYGSILALAIVLLSSQCAQVQQTRQPQQPVDVKAVAQAGMDSLAAGNWQAAARAFSRAIQADPEYAVGYSGMALVLAIREQPEKALEYANRAISKDPTSVQAHISKGRVLLLADEYANAMTAFDQALELQPKSEEALFYKAHAAGKAQQYEVAIRLYKEVVEMQGDYMSRAKTLFERMRKTQLAAPRTAVGERVLEKDAITRGDLAALLVNEFGLLDMVNRRDPNFFSASTPNNKANVTIVDAEGHWAEPWIRDVVAVGAMDVYPDNSFRPTSPVLRMNFAMTIQNIIILVTGDRSLDTAFIGSPARYPDVKPTHYAFNAISMVTEYGIMGANSLTGEFDLDGTLSGLDALIALRKVQDTLNTSF